MVTLLSLQLCKATTCLSFVVLLANALFPHGSHRFREVALTHVSYPYLDVVGIFWE